MLCPPLIRSGAHEDGGDLHGFCDFRPRICLEIEQAFIESLYQAFDKEQEPTNEMILQVIAQSVPLSKTMGEQIDALRAWAKTRAQNATSIPRPPSGTKRKILDLANN